jgi:pimeloyl-ACP methyl ester carboxylesterase
MTKLTISGLFVFALFLTGCSDSSNYNFEQGIQETQTSFDSANIKAIFDPRAGKIPPTNDLLFIDVNSPTGLSQDGTLNIPFDDSLDSEGQKAVKAALNNLDGFSTTAPVTTGFNSSLAPASVKLGETIRVFELTNTGQAEELTSSNLVATATGTNNTTLAILPVKPLKPKTRYLVVLTNGLKGVGDVPVKADTIYTLAKGGDALTGDFEGLETLRKVVNGYENLADAAGIAKDSIVLSWSFTTQSIGDVMQNVFDNSTASTITTVPTGKTTKDFLDPEGTNDLVVGKADVHIGSMKVPYYLDAPTEANPTGPLTGFWKGANDAAVTQLNLQPVKTQDVTVPVIITVPSAVSKAGATPPAEGWPVIIFQHGVTANRSSTLAIANAYADAGFMVIGIDMVLHGITDTSHPLHADNSPFAEDKEPSMGLDFVDNTTLAAGPDEKPDDSGTHFINLSSLLTSRDNIRQSVANLFVLRKSLANMVSASGGEAIPVDENIVRFSGHSLGGMVGTNYLAFDDTVGAASFFMPGGGIAQLLNGSESFGPKIRTGLEAKGVSAGTPEFDAFFIAAQTVLDSADPINFGAEAAAKHPIHMTEVIGGNSSPSDRVIPNRVEGAPLSGTEPLAAVMSLPAVTVPGGTGSGIVRFTAGDHSSILRPTASLEATIEMQTETATFLATNGAKLPVAAGSPVQ